MAGRQDSQGVAELQCYPQPVHGVLMACKKVCYKLVTTLYKHRTAETIEFLSTCASCNRILQMCLDQCKGDGRTTTPVIPDFLLTSFPLLKRMLEILERYGSALGKLLTGGKFARLLSGSRVRKQLEAHNVNLYGESQKLEKKLSFKKLLEIIEPQDDILKSLMSEKALLLADPAAASLWESFGKDKVMVQWEDLLFALKARVNVQAADEGNLRSVLDSSKSGYVSIYNFANYVKCFGPFSAAIGNLRHILNAEYDPMTSAVEEETGAR